MAIKLTGDPHGIEPVVEETVLDKNGKPKKHFYFGNLLVTFSGIALGIMGAMAIVPLLVLLVGFFALLLFLLIILGASAVTFFLIWLSEEFRDFISGYSDFLGSIFDNEFSDKLILFARGAYWFVLFIGGAVILISLIYTIIAKINDKEKSAVKTGHLISLIVMTVLFIIASVVCGFFYILAQ